MKYHGLDSIRSARVRPQLRSNEDYALRLGIYSDAEQAESEAKNTLIMKKKGGVQGNCDSRRTIINWLLSLLPKYHNHHLHLPCHIIFAYLRQTGRTSYNKNTHKKTNKNKKENKTPMAGPRYCAAGRSACRCHTPDWKPLRLVSPAEVHLLPGWEKPAGSASRTRRFHQSSFLNNNYILMNKEEGS